MGTSMDNSSYLSTKLHVPSVKDTNVSREALYSKLDESLKTGHRMILVSAEAGYGKTTLISGWIARTNQVCAWLSLDAYDNDPATFIGYLVAAIRRCNKEFGSMIENIMTMPKLPGVDVVSSYITGELAKITDEIILVFDDYQNVANSYIHKLMQRLIDAKAHKAFIVLLTRQDPPFSLSRWRAEDRMTELRAADLRFGAAEIKELFDKSFGISLQNDALGILEERTEGWAAGLQLIGLSVRSMKKDQQKKSLAEQLSGNNRFIADYLMEEVFAKQEARIRTFLKKTCMLKSFTEELCDMVTGLDCSKRIIDKLEKENLFIVPLDNDRTWYRYHNLFSEFLCSGLDESKKTDIFRKAAAWCRDKGLTEQAVEYALKARDGGMALSMFETISRQYLHDGAIKKLLALIDEIKEISSKTDDEVEICRAWCLFILGETNDARKALKELKGKGRTENPETAGKIKALEAILCADTAQVKAVRLAEEAVSLLEGENRLYHNVALRTLGLVMNSAGDLEGAARAFKKMLEGVDYKHYRLIELSAFVNYTDCLIAMGRRREALNLCEELLAEYTDRYGEPLPLAGMIYLPMGICCYIGNELEKAKKYLYDGIGLCMEMKLISTIGNAEAYYVKTLYALGDKSAAFKALRKYKNLSAGSGHKNIFEMLEAMEIDLYIKEKSSDIVLEWMKEHPDSDELTYIRALIDNKIYDEAILRLEEAEEAARNRGGREKLITILILRALAEKGNGNEENALNYMGRALQTAAQEGYLRNFMDEGDAVIALVNKVHDAAPDFADKLENGGAGQSEGLFEPLKDKEIEIVKLIAAGLSNAEISGRLYITTGTVKWYVKNIYSKMGVNKRTQAVRKARRLGIID
jgi:LuxR family maltose regulon positive regulatory protein